MMASKEQTAHLLLAPFAFSFVKPSPPAPDDLRTPSPESSCGSGSGIDTGSRSPPAPDPDLASPPSAGAGSGSSLRSHPASPSTWSSVRWRSLRWRVRRGWGEAGPDGGGESRPAAPRRRCWRWRLGEAEEEELGEEEGDLHQCIVKEGMGRGVHGRGGRVTPSGSRHGQKRLELFQ